MNRMRQVILSPVLAFQALQVILRTPRLSEPDGARSGSMGSGPVIRLLIVGDSSAAGVGVNSQSEALSGQVTKGLAPHFNVHWRLIAKTGKTTAQMPALLERVTETRFDVAVTALGVNDVTRLVPPVKWVAQTRLLHDLLRQRFGVQNIFVTDMPPIAQFPALPNPLARALGERAQAMMAALFLDTKDDDQCHVVSPDWGFEPSMMALDGFHPSADVYAYWGAFMAQRILSVLHDDART